MGVSFLYVAPVEEVVSDELEFSDFSCFTM
jgi:hypothetical protein